MEAKAGSEGDDLERELFILRKLIEKKKAQEMGEDAADFYVASLSDKTIVYKVSRSLCCCAWHIAAGLCLNTSFLQGCPKQHPLQYFAKPQL